MERDLHDGAQQYMALIGLQLSNHAENVASDPNLRAEVEELRSTLAAAQAELRNLAHGIYPATLETEGLAPAIREAAGRATVPVTVTSDGVNRLAREVEAALYFCCLEALQNVGKYAGPEATARVALSRMDSRINFTVSDDGIGFDVAARAHGHGLINMQDRIGALGGEIAVTSAPNEGTIVAGWVPADATPG
jgi:signal transduction histidine kinase